MARVRAFCGIYYQDKAGQISELVAPPYDVLSVSEANKYRSQSPFNVAHISVSVKGDPGFYLRAHQLFESWQKDGVLTRSEKPGIYFYETEFEYRLGGEIRNARRTGFFALLGVADYSAGEVLRHERTLKSPKLDQFNLLSTTCANLSPIFCLYSDPELKLIKSLSSAKPEKPVFNFEFSGLKHRLFGIYDSELISEVRENLLRERVYIADGHHRYETALEYYHRLRFGKDPLTESAGYIMSFFCPVEDSGLIIFPYHRLVNHLPGDRLSGLMKKLEEDFEVKPLGKKFNMGSASEVFQALDLKGTERAMIMVDSSRDSFLLRLKKDLESKLEQFLDVEILEDLILKRILKISKEELTENRYISYETSEDKLVKRIESDNFQLCFLIRPIKVESIIERSNAGQVMPEKSTYFYPKLPTGMVFRKIAPGPDLS